jgi:hypothetical protein
LWSSQTFKKRTKLYITTDEVQLLIIIMGEYYWDLMRDYCSTNKPYCIAFYSEITKHNQFLHVLKLSINNENPPERTSPDC